MRLVHGGLALELPAGWADQSTLLFTGPVDDKPLPTAHKAARAGESLAITFAAAEPGVDAAAVVADEIDKMRAADAQLEVLEQKPFTCGLGPGRLAVLRFHLADVVLRQVSAAVVVGPVAVRASASCLDAAYDKKAATLLALISSLSFAKGPS